MSVKKHNWKIVLDCNWLMIEAKKTKRKTPKFYGKVYDCNFWKKKKTKKGKVKFKKLELIHAKEKTIRQLLNTITMELILLKTNGKSK